MIWRVFSCNIIAMFNLDILNSNQAVSQIWINNEKDAVIGLIFKAS